MASPVTDPTVTEGPPAPAPSRTGDILLRAWLTVGVVDALWACVFALVNGRSIEQLWKGVAAVPFGPAMMEGGAVVAGVGLLMHFVTAFTWSAVFLVAYTRWASLRRMLDAPAGIAGVSAVYGPLIWIVMSMGVIPVFTGSPGSFTLRWAIQLCGHVPFVGLPIVWSVVKGSR